MGAVCQFCGKDMLKANGCKPTPIVINGELWEPVKFGDSDCDYPFDENTRCHDCGAKIGYYHHAGCDWERCPKCGGQVLTDDCMDENQEFDATQYEQFLKKIGWKGGK